MVETKVAITGTVDQVYYHILVFKASKDEALF